MVKRLLDILGSLIGLFLFSPLLTFIAIWIKLDSKGPILFRQERVGRYGKPFWIHKFRTMEVDAESRGLQLTTAKDKRITRCGQFLRKYKLDELAQLIDVLRGDMSLVGPRPEVPKYVAHYPPKLKEIALSVKPGITDISSIEYRDENDILANAKDAERTYIEQILPAKLKYHKKYATEQSLLLDLYLIFKTVTLVFGRWLPDTLNVLGTLTRSQKRLIILAFDLIALPLAFWTAMVLLEETFTPKISHIWWIFPLIPLITIPIFIYMGLYRAVIRYMEDESAYTILYSVSLSVFTLLCIVMFTQQISEFHKSVFAIYWMIAFIYIGSSRMIARTYYRKIYRLPGHKKRAIIYGAGQTGAKLALNLLATGGKTAVAFIDEDPSLQGHKISGIKVYPPTVLARLIDNMHIDHILLAIPSMTSAKRAEILTNLEQLHLHAHHIPSVSELIYSEAKTNEIREVNIEWVKIG